MERRSLGKAGSSRPRADGWQTASEFIPANPTQKKLQQAAKKCTACPLWKSGTQTVFGEGSIHARVFLIGEQPGNEEDLAGKPFVGPAGKLLDKALESAGINRGQTYVTNVVKHFKWEPKGKRRLHKKPNSREIAACRPWLEAELDLIRPEVLICLGATAAQALLGKDFRVSKQRGEFVESELASLVMATIHPSAVLRSPDEEARHEEMKHFVADLKIAAQAIYNLESTQWKTVDSSAIGCIRYHTELEFLDVRFKSDGCYRYGKVQKSQFEEMQNSDSLGAYINEAIKPHHPCWKIQG